MLSGRLPFNAEDEDEIARRVAYDEPDYERNPAWRTVSDDAKSVLQGLAERIPAIDIRDNILEEDIAAICDSLYSMGENKKKFLL